MMMSIDRRELELIVGDTLRRYLEGESLPAPQTPDPPTPAVLGAAVRAELARRDVHPKALADELGLTTATVRLRMRGVYPFRDDEMETVLRMLDLTLGELHALARHGARFTEPRDPALPSIPEPTAPAIDVWAQPPRSLRRGRAY
ncbi:hypothetical protein [Microbacterium testaceum]|uniref:hypothetical protein n=1 Tax=Microbacterium testaceum TaxID=2033 RepID=UPI0022E2CC3A|nr:hypothetical protein [Microbacterium testaceum]